MKKKFYLGLTVAGFLILTLLIGSGVVAAKTSSSYPLIVQRLAERFNLQPEEVNKVFTQVQQERWKQRQTLFEERLETAVKDGKITRTQKEALLKKRAEIQKKMDEIRNSSLTPQEKWEKLSKLRLEMQNWAKDNQIDLSLCLGPGFGPGIGWGKGGRGFGEGFGSGAGGCPNCFNQP